MYSVYLFLFNEMSCLYLHAPLATSCPVGRSVLPHEQLQVRRSQIVRRWLHDQSTVIRTYSARVVDLCLVDLSWSRALSTDTPIPTIIVVRKVVLSSFLPINGWSTTRQRVGFWVLRMGVGNIDAVVTTRECQCVRSSRLFPRYGTDGDMHPRVSIDRSLSH